MTQDLWFAVVHCSYENGFRRENYVPLCICGTVLTDIRGTDEQIRCAERLGVFWDYCENGMVYWFRCFRCHLREWPDDFKVKRTVTPLSTWKKPLVRSLGTSYGQSFDNVDSQTTSLLSCEPYIRTHEGKFAASKNLDHGLTSLEESDRAPRKGQFCLISLWTLSSAWP